MRQIVLDTETTGLDPALGHRIIELGAIELVDRRLTERRFHRYLNPGRESDSGALQVHGLTTEFLQDKPRFRDIVAEFLDFVRGAELIIHNAPFDVGFLNAELALVQCEPIEACCGSITDTLRLAKDLHPGKRNGLDALCERYQVDNSSRTLHGALLDAQLLAEVYLAMTRGQESLAMDLEPRVQRQSWFESGGERVGALVLGASEAERAEHDRVLNEIEKASGGQCLWKILEATPEYPVGSCATDPTVRKGSPCGALDESFGNA